MCALDLPHLDLCECGLRFMGQNHIADNYCCQDLLFGCRVLFCFCMCKRFPAGKQKSHYFIEILLCAFYCTKLFYIHVHVKSRHISLFMGKPPNRKAHSIPELMTGCVTDKGEGSLFMTFSFMVKKLEHLLFTKLEIKGYFVRIIEARSKRILKRAIYLTTRKDILWYRYSVTSCCCCLCGFKAQQCLGQRYGLKTLSTTKKPPFLTKFGLRLQVQAYGFELTTPILEAARSNH